MARLCPNPFLFAGLLVCAVGCAGTAPVAHGPAAHLELPIVDGSTRTLDDERGRVVVLHFFATWSAAAQMDVTVLNRAFDTYDPADLTIVGVALDPDGRQLVVPWLDAVGARYEIAILPELSPGGGDAAHPSWGAIRAVPTTVVLDRTGRVVWRWGGALPPRAFGDGLASVQPRSRLP